MQCKRCIAHSHTTRKYRAIHHWTKGHMPLGTDQIIAGRKIILTAITSTEPHHATTQARLPACQKCQCVSALRQTAANYSYICQQWQQHYAVHCCINYRQ